MHVMTGKKRVFSNCNIKTTAKKNGFLLVHGMSYVHVSGPLLHVEIDPVLHVVIVPYVKKSNSITCMESIMAYYGEKIEIAVEALRDTTVKFRFIYQLQSSRVQT